MRSFILRNARGEDWNLNDIGSFLSEPKGLGYERKEKYLQTGDSFVRVEKMLKQKTIQGTIRFRGYPEYGRFCRHIQFEPLTLIYTSDDTYSIRVNITKLEKTELETGGLFSNITMTGLGIWYKTANFRVEEVQGGKEYPYSYPYVYRDNTSGQIIFQSDSVSDSPIRLVIIGPCTNPMWVHYINGQSVAMGRVECMLDVNERLIVDATSNPYDMAVYDNAGRRIRDVYQYSDFRTERFLHAGYGENKIDILNEGSDRLMAEVEVRIGYESA